MADDGAGDNEELLEPAEKASDQDIRCFLVRHYSDPEIDGAIMVQNLEALFQWVRHGTVAKKAKGAKEQAQPTFLRSAS